MKNNTTIKCPNNCGNETMKIVFRDGSFADSVVKANALAILKQFEIDEAVGV